MVYWTVQLDIYHALEHVAACGKALYGSGLTFTDWYEQMRGAVIGRVCGNGTRVIGSERFGRG
jgi:hypothetical protein